MTVPTVALPPDAPPTETARFPRWLLAIGVLNLLGLAVLTANIIWLQTVVSWEYGPQSGWALMHSALGLLILCPLIFYVWLPASVLYFAWRLRKRRPLSRPALVVMGLSVAVFGILAFSGEIWHRVFADRLANGSYAAGFFTEAASAGDLTTVAAFLANGTTVDIRRRRDGWTGLHAAAAGGHTDVIRYLVAAGADVNAIDRVGDSPLQLATAEHHEDAARLLADHGARIIRGSDEQLRQAIRNIVDADAKSPWRSSKTPADALRWISGK